MIRKKKRKSNFQKILQIILIFILLGALVFLWKSILETKYITRYVVSKYPKVDVFNANNEIIDSIIRGEEIEVLYSERMPNDDTKVKVKYNDKEAYISISNIAESRDKVRQEETVYVTHFTHLRDKEYGNLKEPVYYGEELKVIGGDIQSDGEIKWYQVEYNEEPRYILNKYVSVDKPGPKKTVFPAPFEYLEYLERDLKDYPGNPRRDDIKAFYVSGPMASTNIDKYINLVKKTEANALVVDIKHDSGRLLFEVPGAEKYAKDANKNTLVKDINTFMKKLKDNDIYLIGRIVAFKGDQYFYKSNPESAVIRKDTGKPHTDKWGSVYLSPHNRKLWEYNLLIAKEAARLGFNEIQFDYVRFSEGSKDAVHDNKNIYEETKVETIGRFLDYAYDELSNLGVYVAADMFPTVLFSDYDANTIGQYYPLVASIVDYSSLMVYPSHYAPTDTYNPDFDPYGTVNRTMKKAFELDKLIEHPAEQRPWIQAFSLGNPPRYKIYTAEDVLAEIRALADNQVYSWFLWNARNAYEPYLDAIR
jgi:hypothetical protein